MAYKNKAYIKDANMIFSTAQALPNNTSVAATNVVNYGGNSGGRQKIVVTANTAITVGAGAYLTVVAAYGSTTSPTDTLDAKRLVYANNKTFAIGDVICSEIIPDDLADNYHYVKLTYTTTENLSATSVNAIVTAV